MYRAVVTRATAAGIWFSVQSRWPGVEFGPCPHLANAVRMPGTVVGLADLIERGDSVLVAETAPADFVVLGVIRGGIDPTGGL
jgi:hypothetical protein